MASGAAPCSEQRSSTGKAEKSAVGRGRRGAVTNPLGTGHCEVVSFFGIFQVFWLVIGARLCWGNFGFPNFW